MIIYDETDDKKYSGYMYGNSGTLDDYRLNTYDSTIKIAIDNWYEKSILINSDINGYVFDEYVSKSAIYCNDRATMNNLSYYYWAYNRLEIVLDDKIRKPSYNCGIDQNGELLNNSSIDDKFSASDVIGNGKLKYPVALMTADEISFAGGLAVSTLTSSYAYYYLNANNESVTGTLAWWTLSPNQSYGNNIQNYIISGSGNPGFLGNVYNNKVYGVRPVLSLKSCTFWSNGNGSSTSPYEVFIDNACLSVEN